MPVYWEAGNSSKGVTPLDEVKLVGKEFLKFRGDVIGDALQVAEGLTPKGKTGRTIRGWGAQVGNLSYGGVWRAKGPAVARTFLQTLTKPGDSIFFGNDWFVSGFHEHGTKRGMRARHMMARGVEAVKDRRG